MTAGSTEQQAHAISPSYRRLALAFGALRRGEIIMIRASDNRAAIMRAAEFADYEDGQLTQIADSAPLLCLRRQHVEALGRSLTGTRPVFTTSAKKLEADAIFKIIFGEEERLPADLSLMGEKQDSLADLATTLLRQAKLLPSAIMANITSDDPQHQTRLADMYGMPIINAFDSAHHDTDSHWQMTIASRAKLPLAAAPDASITMFRNEGGDENHFAIIVGEGDKLETPLVRLHSQCVTGDVLGSLKCDCGPQLQTSLARMHEAGGGVLLYLAQEGRDIGLLNKIRAYSLQDGGHDTVDANHRLGFATDERIFIPAAAMLKQLGISSVRLLTNNPDKVEQLEKYGIKVAQREGLSLTSNPYNEAYLSAKKEKTGHFIDE